MQSINKETSCNTLILSGREIFIMLSKNIKKDFKQQLCTLNEKLADQLQGIYEIEQTDTLRLMLKNMGKRWENCNRTQATFLKHNSKWLEGEIILQKIPVIQQKATENVGISSESRKNIGRPSKTFLELSDRSKRRKTSVFRASTEVEELTYATQMSLRESGASQAASVLKDLTSSPGRAGKYQAAYKLAQSYTPASEISAELALSDIVESKMTRHAYEIVRKRLNQCKAQVYPQYDKILQAKVQCYPKNMIISEHCAEVPLQSLLDHTCSRILTVQRDVIQTLKPEVTKNLKLIVKYGFDGSSGQSQYKQNFKDENVSDNTALFTSLVPLVLVAENTSSNEKLMIWKNPKPSSPRYCRPIRLQFLRETASTTLEEQKYIDEQISTLIPLNILQNDQQIVVTYKLVFTMIDGKVRNAITMTKSPMRCYLCNATSAKFNDLNYVLSLPRKESNLCYGLATLHAWIHFFEYFLHIGYKLVTQKWQARRDEDKEKVRERKKIIQDAFKSEMGLIVDVPKSGGYGNSNDGNTARRFFASSKKSSQILGVEYEVIHRAHIVLQVLSSGFAVDVDKFKDYCLQTAKMLVDKYPWYCMPTSIHEVLIHGPLIVEWAPLPIGLFSEEAQESRNKDIKKYRDGYSRKCSRQKNMEDVFHWLLVTSDPVITSLRTEPPKERESLSSEAVKLLVPDECFANTANFLCSA